MRLIVAAVGRLKRGAETELAARYIERAQALGRNLGFTLSQFEIPEGRGERAVDRRAAEGESLLELIPDGAALIALDERGSVLGSAEFSDLLRKMRDEGTKNVVFVLGGPDGLSEELRRRAARTIAFGAMTWPHQLARIMLAEQLYRALAMLAGHPYHRA